MSTEQNKIIVRRLFEEGLNQHKPQVFDELIASDYVNHDLPTPATGAEGFKMVVDMFLAAFSNFQTEINDIVGEGDKVATRGTWTGTHKGEFNGIPATGKQVKVGYIDIWRVENGKLIENWVQMDMVGLMQQLGVIPAPEAA